MKEIFRHKNFFKQVEYRLLPTMLLHNDKGPALVDPDGNVVWYTEGIFTKSITSRGEVTTKTLSMDRFGNVKPRGKERTLFYATS